MLVKLEKPIFDFEKTYYKNNLTNEYYFNKRDIEESISIGDYNLYIDYSKNIYLELNNIIEDSTQSFW